MIQIHEDKCIRCLRCADKCVCGAIEVRDGRPVINRDKGCIKCMHCAIACPENAITYNGQPAIESEEMPVLADTFSADMENFLLAKRSYRNFKPEPVPMTEIESALNVAAWAPSAKNQHPTKYYVVSGQEEIDAITKYTFKVNDVMREYFDSLGIELIDFKIEFGRYHGQIILADEVSPDTCRLWDKETHEKLDKDRFRRDLGNVEDAYEEVFRRLGIQ